MTRTRLKCPRPKIANTAINEVGTRNQTRLTSEATSQKRAPTVSTNSTDQNLPTPAAAAHLTRALGRNISAATLNTYRCRNVGPPYYKSQNGQMIRYRVADLDAYAAARLAPPMQRIEPPQEAQITT